MAFFIDLLF